MRLLFLIWMLGVLKTQAQCVKYMIGAKGDTLNCVDAKNLKQGKWVVRYDEIRGEPGYEEEGIYVNDKKEGAWRMYNLQGDLMGVENYRWGNKDGKQFYYNMYGDLLVQESWRAFNPESPYDTVKVFKLDNPEEYEWKIVKVDGSSLRNGTWKYYQNGIVTKTEEYEMDKLVKPENKNTAQTHIAPKKTEKPKEVLNYEKTNKGKKSIRYRDGATTN